MREQTTFFPDPGPSLNAATHALFISLCTQHTPAQVDRLRVEVDTHLGHIREVQSRNEFLDVDLAELLARGLNRLLAQYEQYGDDQQRLIVGAARYFVHAEDAENDVHSILGLDDDVQVLNHVLDILGEPQYRIDL